MAMPQQDDYIEQIHRLEGLMAYAESHGVWSCLPLIYLKYLFKIWGFVFRG